MWTSSNLIHKDVAMKVLYLIQETIMWCEVQNNKFDKRVNNVEKKKIKIIELANQNVFIVSNLFNYKIIELKILAV